MASRRKAEKLNHKDKKQLSLYFSKEAQGQRLLERLQALARRRRRSLNFLILEALTRYLKAEEAKERRTQKRTCRR